jgi:hypothetical protein
MRNKRIALIAAAALLLLMPAGYYVFFAFVRHEHFYRGFPTSHWERAIQRWSPSFSVGPSFIPQVDSLLRYLGLHGGTPAVLEGDKAAVPVLLDLIWAGDDSTRSRATVALWRSGKAHSPLACCFYEGYVIKLQDDGATRLALILGDAAPISIGDYTRYIVLMSESGESLDCVTCSVSAKLSAVPKVVERDGAQLVVRYASTRPETSARDTYSIRHAGHSFDIPWGNRPGEMANRDLCRIAVHNGQFVVLWPPLLR